MSQFTESGRNINSVELNQFMALHNEGLVVMTPFSEASHAMGRPLREFHQGYIASMMTAHQFQNGTLLPNTTPRLVDVVLAGQQSEKFAILQNILARNARRATR